MSTQIYPEKDAKKVWRFEELTLSIQWVRDHYCGYVRFKERPFREKGYDGILTYVPVHGGITYADQDKQGMVYGFNCAHCGDYTGPVYEQAPEGYKVWQEDMVIAETEKLAKGLLAAVKFEKRYLTNISNKGKAKVIDEYHKELGEKFNVGDNFGASLKLLSGRL
jgi:hypothetical protein